MGLELCIIFQEGFIIQVFQKVESIEKKISGFGLDSVKISNPHIYKKYKEGSDFGRIPGLEERSMKTSGCIESDHKIKVEYKAGNYRLLLKKLGLIKILNKVITDNNY